MTSSLDRSPDPKDRGLPELESAPCNWDIRRLKHVARLAYGDALPSGARREGNVPVFGSNGRVGFHSVANTLAPCIILGRKGSFGKVRFSRQPVFAIDTTYFIDERHTSASIKWLFYALGSLGLDTASRDTAIPGLNRAEVYARRMPVPPPVEQAAIVQFLDSVDGRIRRYIGAKQTLVKLLEEQNQTIIHRAVTRGLDPNVRFKASGVEMLGDVPAHWEVAALKRVLSRLVDCEHKTAPRVDQSDFRVVRTTAVRNGRLRLQGTYCTSPETFRQWTQRATPEPGDVIFTREAPTGEACLVPDSSNLCLGQRTVLMKVRRDAYDPQFLVHMIYGGPPRIRSQVASQGSTVGHFNMDDIGWMNVLVPPLEEQHAIVAAIAQDTANLTTARERAEREIDLLREYRARLIADVVTGKIDVRESAARLPHETDQPESLDEVEGENDAEHTGAGDFDEVPEGVDE